MQSLCRLVLLFGVVVPLVALSAKKPNIIYILADDLGYGDLGCYGQTTFRTPNIDRMAREGMKFTRHYAGSTVCAPSRCVLMTGLHTGHCRVRGNGPGRLLGSDTTFVSLLKESGYATGCFGKWGIGNPPPINDPEVHGFDEFYGYLNMFHAHNYYPEFLIKNGVKEPLQNVLFDDWRKRVSESREGAGVAQKAIDFAPRLIADAALEFIERNHQEPFFLYYALNIPHANNEAGGERRINRNGMRVPELGEFEGKEWPIQEKGFARMLQYIDQDVGNILAALKRLGIDDNTLVLFSSDNGPHQEGGHQMSFFDSNGPLKGMKRDMYDGGIRVPLIARWTGVVPEDQVSNHISAFQDIFPTVLELAGVSDVPANDGISMVPLLTGNSSVQPKHPYLYWEFYEKGGRRAVLKGHWKGVQLGVIDDPDAPIELYDISVDLGEGNNLASRYPDLISEIEAIMKREHIDL
jgi:arylsulfatase A-like enzyme